LSFRSCGRLTFVSARTRNEGDARARVNTCRFQTETLNNSGTAPRGRTIALPGLASKNGVHRRLRPMALSGHLYGLL
jgi:hypothetical protein